MIEKNASDSVSSKQLVALTFIIGLGLNILNLPALCVMTSAGDGWIAMLIISAADCLALWFTLLIMQRASRAAAKGKLQRVLSACFNTILLLWAAVKLTLLLGETRMFFGKIVFENLDWLVYLVIPLALIAVLGAGGCRGMGRLCEIVLPIAAGSVLIIVITTFAGDTNVGDIFPSLQTADAFVSPLKLMLWTGNYPVLMCLFKNVKFKRHTKLFCVSAAAVSAAAASAITLALSASYGALAHLIDYGSNASNMTMYVGSYNFGRIDLIVFTVWSIVLLIEAGVFQLCCVRAASNIFGREKPRLYSAAVAVIMYALLNFVLPTNNHLLCFATGVTGYIAGAAQFLLPAIGAAVCLFIKPLPRQGEAIYDEK